MKNFHIIYCIISFVTLASCNDLVLDSQPVNTKKVSPKTTVANNQPDQTKTTKTQAVEMSDVMLSNTQVSAEDTSNKTANSDTTEDDKAKSKENTEVVNNVKTQETNPIVPLSVVKPETLEQPYSDDHFKNIKISENLCQQGGNDDYTFGYNFVAGDQQTCTNSITRWFNFSFLQKIGEPTTCTKGGGCGLNGLKSSPSNPSPNSQHWGACIQVHPCEQDKASANKARRLYAYLWGKLPSPSSPINSDETRVFQATFLYFNEYNRKIRSGDCGYILSQLVGTPESKKFLDQWSDRQFVELLLQSFNLELSHPLNKQAQDKLKAGESRDMVAEFIGRSAEFNEYCRRD